MQAVGQFLGRVIVAIFQGVFTIVGGIHGILVGQFGQNRTYAGYVVAAVLFYAYLTGTLEKLIGQLFQMLNGLLLLAVTVAGLVIILRAAAQVLGIGGGRRR